MSSSGTKPPGPEGTDPFAENELGHLTDAQAAAIDGWLQQVAPLIGLHGWRIHLSLHVGSDSTAASSSVRANSDEVWVAVELDHAQVAERYRRATLTHELLHCHLQPLTIEWLELAEEYAPSAAVDVARSTIGGFEERTIERMAWAISEFLPPCPEL